MLRESQSKKDILITFDIQYIKYFNLDALWISASSVEDQVANDLLDYLLVACLV